MKIFALTCFVICLITVLSLQVESFENHEGKPTPKKGATKKGAANGLALCKKVKFDAKKNTISAECKAKKAKKSRQSYHQTLRLQKNQNNKILQT